MRATPWAIILCKYDDIDAEPYPRLRYEQLFTSAGAGMMNMTDYFDAMSHGNVDLGGSQVFGWYRLTQKRADYVGSGANDPGRNDLIAWGRKAATDAGVDLSAFYNVVVVTNATSDLFGKTIGVVTDDGRAEDGESSLSPSQMGHEMCHGYGLAHSRIEGSYDDYRDVYDVMSVRNADMAPHPVFTELDQFARPLFRVGPGLNAANMDSLGWLDPARVWQALPRAAHQRVELRPLHRRDLPGYLCAIVGDHYVELRVPDRWDAAIGSARVLIHQFSEGNSYLEHDANGANALGLGDRFTRGYVADPPHLIHGAGLKIEVTAIDPVAQTATIEVTHYAAYGDFTAGPGTILGGVLNDGGGLISVNGTVIRVPPRSPVATILERSAAIAASGALEHGLGIEVRRRSFAAIARLADAEAAEIGRVEAIEARA